MRTARQVAAPRGVRPLPGTMRCIWIDEAGACGTASPGQGVSVRVRSGRPQERPSCLPCCKQPATATDFSQLPEGVREDVRTFFGTYSRGLADGLQLLHSAADPGSISLACEDSSVGWQDEDALYVHAPSSPASHLSCVPTSDVGNFFTATPIKPTLSRSTSTRGRSPSSPTTIRLGLVARTALRAKVNLRTRSVDVFDHTGKAELLYFKERFLPAEDPQREALCPSLTPSGASASMTSLPWSLALAASGYARAARRQRHRHPRIVSRSQRGVSVIEITHNFDPSQFMWLWSKYVTGFNDAYHCTNSIRGSYSRSCRRGIPTTELADAVDGRQPVELTARSTSAGCQAGLHEPQELLPQCSCSGPAEPGSEDPGSSRTGGCR